MDEPQEPVPDERPTEADPYDDLPPGNHPVELAARAGIGPLSPLGREVWHGEAIPCVSCGQLVRRGETECEHCGQDLRVEMIEKMRAHAGPWYVLEHVRPFPGVTLERLVRQIRRGFLTQTSIVRGPGTDHQWRFAVETPGLCRYFGRCWKCQQQVSPSDASCPSCLSSLGFEERRAGAAGGPGDVPRAAASTDSAGIGGPAGRPGAPGSASTSTAPPTAAAATELEALSAAVGEVEPPARNHEREAPARFGSVPVSMVAAIMLLIVIVTLMLVSQCRSEGTDSTDSAALQQAAAVSHL